MHDSKNCPVCRGASDGTSMSDEAFFNFLDVCRAELAEKQERFQQRIKSLSRWRYEMDDGTLWFDDIKFAMTVVGSFSTQYQTWLWGWANETFPVKVREKSLLIRGLYLVTGFNVVDQAGTQATSLDAQDFCAMAIHHLGAVAMYKVPTGEGSLYLAVQEEMDPLMEK